MEVAGIAPASESILDKESFTCLAQILDSLVKSPMQN